MSDAWAAVRFEDGTVRYCTYQGSSDTLKDVLFDTATQAWEAKRTDAAADYGPADGQTVPVRIYSDYGRGLSWNGTALADKSRVIDGCDPYDDDHWDTIEYHNDSTAPEWAVFIW